jgi:hypothetical protein
MEESKPRQRWQPRDELRLSGEEHAHDARGNSRVSDSDRSQQPKRSINSRGTVHGIEILTAGCYAKPIRVAYLRLTDAGIN